MEDKPRLIRRRSGKSKKKFFKRRVKLKFLSLTYFEILLFLVFYVVFLIGIFNRVIYAYLSTFFE